MKNPLSSVWLWSLPVLALVIGIGTLFRSSNSGETSVSGAPPEITDSEKALLAPDEDSSDAAKTEEPVTNAAFRVVSTDLSVPASVRLTPAAVEIVKLASAGLEEKVMLGFVAHSKGGFALGSDEIIYLTDIGIPTAVIKAMILRDHTFPEEAAPFAASIAVGEPAAEDRESSPLLDPAAEPVLYSEAAPQPPAEGLGSPAEPELTGEPDFSDALAPYGNWVEVAGYGRCWQPTVALRQPNWQPYCDGGRWVESDRGCYWSSSYSWGWAPFHYGRWFHHTSLNWCWVPDPVWAPAWVCWRTAGQYCGWAPLPPATHVTSSGGITFHGHPVSTNFHFHLPESCFRFVATNHFGDPHLARHVIPRDKLNGLFPHTVVHSGIGLRNQRVMNEGPFGGHTGHPQNSPASLVSLHSSAAVLPYGQRERFESNGTSLVVFGQNMRMPVRTLLALNPLGKPNRNSGSLAQSHLGMAPAPIENLLSSALTHPPSPSIIPSPKPSTPNHSLTIIGHKGGQAHASPYVYFASASEAHQAPPASSEPHRSPSPANTSEPSLNFGSGPGHFDHPTDHPAPQTKPTSAWGVPKPPQQQHSRATDNSAPEAAAHSSRVTHAAEKPQHEHLTGHANDRTSAPVHQAPHQTTHQSDTHAVRHSDPPPAPVAHQTAATPSTHQPTSSSHDTSSSSHDHSSSGRR